MATRLNSMTVGVRLWSGFVALSIVLILVGALAIFGFGQQRSATARVAEAMQLEHAAMQLKFQAADFTAWQTGYAFDVNRGLVGAADDSGIRRCGFLDSTASFKEQLTVFQKMPLTAEERELVKAISADFDAFMALDKRHRRLRRRHGGRTEAVQRAGLG